MKVKSSNRGSVLTTIVDVMKMHRSEEKDDVKDMSCERYEDLRVRIPPDSGAQNVSSKVSKSLLFSGLFLLCNEEPVFHVA